MSKKVGAGALDAAAKAGASEVEKQKVSAPPKSPLHVGNAVLVRTVTFFYSGRIVLLTPEEIVLEDAAWIADTGRFATALEKGTLEEVEPYRGPVSISRAAVVDATTWAHALPREAK